MTLTIGFQALREESVGAIGPGVGNLARAGLTKQRGILLALFKQRDQRIGRCKIKVQTIVAADFPVDGRIASQRPMAMQECFNNWQSEALDDRRKNHSATSSVAILKLGVRQVMKCK